MSKSDMWIDSVLYVSIGVFTFMQGYLSSDEAYKYINPYYLFWMKLVVGSCAAGAASLKMYRSTGFGDHKKLEQETQMFRREQPKP